jgi:hypothetical protein
MERMLHQLPAWRPGFAAEIIGERRDIGEGARSPRSGPATAYCSPKNNRSGPEDASQSWPARRRAITKAEAQHRLVRFHEQIA